MKITGSRLRQPPAAPSSRQGCTADPPSAEVTAVVDSAAAHHHHTWVSFCLRFSVITGVLLLTQLRVLWPVLRAQLSNRRDLRNRYLGEALARAAEILGPVFTKAAQAISYRADLLPESLLCPLARLQERVRPLHMPPAREAMAAALSRPLNVVFSSVDDLPIACGSIATVYRATTNDGDVVAVKIVRPGVSDAIDLDIACLRMLAKRAARMPFAAGIPVTEIFNSIADMIVAQCDMSREARNLQAFARSAAQTRGIVLPREYADGGASPSALVMEYLSDGLAFTSPDLLEWQFKSAALHVLRFVYRMIFIDGFVHCDLHPGNIRVRNDGTVYLFDAGLVASLSAADREHFRAFFLALAMGDAKTMTQVIVDSAITMPADLARTELEADVGALVRAYSGRNAGSFLVAEFVYCVFTLQKKYRLYGAPGFVCAIWALLMFEGLIRNRYPDLDFQTEARPYAIASLLSARSNPRSSLGTPA
jgi:ubiquinone biosynthesis protein